jgi:uncharacterized membrane protein/protein-disulfide isomerase
VTPTSTAARRGPLRLALIAALAGVALSILLVRVHAQAHAGVESFCTISDVVNCDRVAVSPYSVVLGIPVALWGVIGFGLAAALAAAALRSSAASMAWSGLLLLDGAFAVLASIVLAFISEFEIGALCLLCAGGWLSALVLAESARRACHDRGALAAVGDGLALLRSRPGRTVAAGAVAVAALTAAGILYPRYWDRPVARPAPVAGAPTTIPAAAGASPSVLVEYSDYECPFCARAHEDSRLLREKRPDITLVRRHFPLDSTCNAAVKRQMHATACMLARAAICAQEQGKFNEMDDALFRNQKEGRPVMDIVRSLGIEPGRFQACIGAPETERRLQSDIAAALRDGVRATPTYVIGGQVRSGDFPWELLPPPPSQPSPAKASP